MLSEPSSLTLSSALLCSAEERGTLWRTPTEHLVPCRAESWETWGSEVVSKYSMVMKSKECEARYLGPNPGSARYCVFRIVTLALHFSPSVTQ